MGEESMGTDEFDSEFWRPEFNLDAASAPGPLAVAKMVQANKHVPHDTNEFNRNAIATAEKFVALMAKFK